MPLLQKSVDPWQLKMNNQVLSWLEKLPFLESTNQILCNFRTTFQFGDLLDYPQKILQVFGILLLGQQLKDLI